MKIAKVEVIQIETPRYYGHVSGHVLVKVHVDDSAAQPLHRGEAAGAGLTAAAFGAGLAFSIRR